MSDKLRIDMGALDDLWRSLCIVSAELGSAKYATDALGAAVGHHVLEDRVHEFSSKWDHTRGTIVADVDTVWHQAKALHQTWVGADQQLSQILKADGGQGSA